MSITPTEFRKVMPIYSWVTLIFVENGLEKAAGTSSYSFILILFLFWYAIAMDYDWKFSKGHTQPFKSYINFVRNALEKAASISSCSVLLIFFFFFNSDVLYLQITPTKFWKIIRCRSWVTSIIIVELSCHVKSSGHRNILLNYDIPVTWWHRRLYNCTDGLEIPSCRYEFLSVSFRPFFILI